MARNEILCRNRLPKSCLRPALSSGKGSHMDIELFYSPGSCPQACLPGKTGVLPRKLIMMTCNSALHTEYFLMRGRIPSPLKSATDFFTPLDYLPFASLAFLRYLCISAVKSRVLSGNFREIKLLPNVLDTRIGLVARRRPLARHQRRTDRLRQPLGTSRGLSLIHISEPTRPY